jgi:hypothetical protein
MARCASCGATIEWRRNVKTNKLAPIDVEPNPGGNVVLDADGRYRVLTRAELTRPPRADEVRLAGHFWTCPSAAKHRGRRVIPN